MRRRIPELIDDVTAGMELMVRGLEDPEREVRLAFARRLVRAGTFTPEVVPVFLEMGLDLLGPLGEAALPPLRSALAHSHPQVRERACRALGEARDQEARTRLLELAAEDPVGSVRLAARLALEKIPARDQD